SGAPELGVPRPLGWLAEISMLVYLPVSGRMLGDVLFDQRAAVYMDLAAACLSALHRSPLALDTAFDVPTELRNLHAWSAIVGDRYPDQARAADRIRRRLSELSPELGAETGRPIHKDFHHQHVFVAERASVIDFDEVCLGDPNFDLGHFCAHLALLSCRVPPRVPAAAALRLEREPGAGTAGRQPPRLRHHRSAGAGDAAGDGGSESPRALPRWRGADVVVDGIGPPERGHRVPAAVRQRVARRGAREGERYRLPGGLALPVPSLRRDPGRCPEAATEERRAPVRPPACPLRPRPDAGRPADPPADRHPVQLHGPRPGSVPGARGRAAGPSRAGDGNRNLLQGQRRLSLAGSP